MTARPGLALSGWARAVALAAGLLPIGLATADTAGAPTALVESVSAPVPGVTPLDYLRQGSTVTLGANDVLVLDYISKCVQETITGGTVTIGANASTDEGGSIKRARIDCDGGDLQLAAYQSQGAVMAYRGIGDEPTLTIGSTAPLILAGATGTLRIERVDKPATAITLDVPALTGNPLRAAVDLAQAGFVLSPGGIYRATLGERKIVFRIAPTAGGADSPIILRVLPL